MAEGARDEVRYTAFLSYSHKDAAAAGKLHRRLESYRLPRRLAGTQTPRGAVPGRLWPIFRDRDELPAASDLSETVRTALAQSGALVILCSPHAAESLWVAEEIATFRTLHPDRPILAAILDGDPPDCFPAALRAFGQDGTWHEPLATDLRPKADGPHLGLLKLVAGITGVGLDELVQRDAARRIRRVMAVTGAAVIAMLIMAALAVVALQARREADRQRAEAEGLVDFMLTDLRDRLRGVGRLDVMGAVNQRALAFYDRQVEEGPGANKVMRARTLIAIGEDGLVRGDLDAALTNFTEARQSTAGILATTPNDTRALLEYARSEAWLGRLHEARGNWALARQQYDHFSRAADRLVALEPSNPDFMREVAWSAVNSGNVRLAGERNAAAAEPHYGRAVQWFARVAAALPNENSKRDLANAYGWLAESLFARQDWPGSLAARERQYRLTREVHLLDPANRDNIYRFALAQRAIASTLTRTGDRQRARAELVQALTLSRRLVESDASNSNWQLLRAMVGCELMFGQAGLPNGVTRAELQNEILAVASALRAQRNPRVQMIANCINAIGLGRLSVR